MKLIKATIEGMKMFLNIDEPQGGVSQALIANKAREKAFMKIMREEVKKGDVCVDIGANIGYCTLTMIKAMGKKGLVHSIEPDEKNLEILNKSIELNNYQRQVKVHQLAISNKIGTFKLYLSEKPNLHSLNKRKNTEDEIDVDVTTLDKLFYGKQFPNFIKMDIEGHEVEALQGMFMSLENKTKEKGCGILMEIHTPEYSETHSLKKELKRLFKIGFKTKYVVSSGDADIKQSFEKRGYEPIAVIPTDGRVRRIYKDMKESDVLELTSIVPQQVRSIFIKKEAVI